LVEINAKHCVDHEIIEPFTVVEEEKSELVANWKETKMIILVPKSPKVSFF
jgi:hypothetical protein